MALYNTATTPHSTLTNTSACVCVSVGSALMFLCFWTAFVLPSALILRIEEREGPSALAPQRNANALFVSLTNGSNRCVAMYACCGVRGNLCMVDCCSYISCVQTTKTAIFYKASNTRVISAVNREIFHSKWINQCIHGNSQKNVRLFCLHTFKCGRNKVDAGNYQCPFAAQNLNELDPFFGALTLTGTCSTENFVRGFFFELHWFDTLANSAIVCRACMQSRIRRKVLAIFQKYRSTAKARTHMTDHVPIHILSSYPYVSISPSISICPSLFLDSSCVVHFSFTRHCMHTIYFQLFVVVPLVGVSVPPWKKLNFIYYCSHINCSFATGFSP